MFLFTSGKPVLVDNAWLSVVPSAEYSRAFEDDFTSDNIRPSGMSLFLAAPSSAFVYNNMGLYTTSWANSQAGSGTNPLLSGLLLNISGQAVTSGNQSMNIFMSGTIENTGTLNLRVRGV